MRNENALAGVVLLVLLLIAIFVPIRGDASPLYRGFFVVLLLFLLLVAMAEPLMQFLNRFRERGRSGQ